MARLLESFERPETGPIITPEVSFVEQIRTPEKEFEAKYALLVISGPPGAGTSSLARSLSELTGASLYKAGDTVRELQGITDRAPDFISREADIDARVDDRVRQMVIKADVTKPAIAEAQIGALTALDTQRAISYQGISQEDKPIIRILLTARKEARDERVYKAALKKGDLNPETGKPYTKEQIRRKNSNRAKGDIKWWKEIYPNLIGNDHPHSLGARDAQGRKIYNLEFDNTELTEKETVDEVLASLREMGLITPAERQLIADKATMLNHKPNAFLDTLRGLRGWFPGNHEITRKDRSDNGDTGN